MPINKRHTALSLLFVAGLTAACNPAADGIDPQGKTFDDVAADEVVTLSGTEPFWNLVIEDAQGVWTTPETPSATPFAVTRFAGNNGLGFSGALEGQDFTATLTPGECSDGMSDRRFPYVATIALGDKTLEGCGYTSRQPFTGPDAP
ncbi:MAG: hypothetical protein GW858_08575 [Sphingomonadales bacterium]|nr:hypothetical protein [Sphingomonadales bacterium]NCQ21082.1 hypothetical protein [Sphingomonadales bacterium]NCT03871.1 hypothetical protein [Sphingomonadales bacterium]